MPTTTVRPFEVVCAELHGVHRHNHQYDTCISACGNRIDEICDAVTRTSIDPDTQLAITTMARVLRTMVYDACRAVRIDHIPLACELSDANYARMTHREEASRCQQ